VYATSGLNAPAIAPEIHDITTADGANLRVYVHGPADARPIVLSHGWCEQAAYWNPQVNALAGEFRVITHDHRGHGASTMGSANPSIELLAEDYAAVLAKTLRPGERAVLAGHSMGGMTIMAWSRDHAADAALRAGAIMLVNTGFSDLIRHTRLVPLVPAGSLPDRLAEYILAGTLAFPPAWLLRPMVKWRIMPGGTRDGVDLCASMFKDIPRQNRGSWGRALVHMDLGGPSPIPGVPTAVIAGECDYLTPPIHAHRIADALREAGTLDKLIVLPGVGHQSNIEAPDTINTNLGHLASLVPQNTEEVA
jgi:pimeloyl-ACP methyl ester carboxylesterase